MGNQRANSLLFFSLTGFLRDIHSMKFLNYRGTEKYFNNYIKKKAALYDMTT